MKLIVCHGISASGKSSFATKWVGEAGARRAEVNRDAIRVQMMLDDGKPFSWRKWNWKREDAVTKAFWEKVEFHAKEGKDLICSDTNLSPKRTQSLIKTFADFGYTEVEHQYFPVTLEEAWARDAERLNGVGHSVIANQYEQSFAIPELHPELKRYTPNPDINARCILVDVDGTLAHMNGKRGAFDWKSVGVDDVDWQVRDLVNAYNWTFSNDTGGLMPSHKGLSVIILSGRDGSCEPETTKWLLDNGIHYDCIFMRKPGDMRKDTIVKEEIFWEHIAPNYNVDFVIDDRPSVARMWRKLGVKTFQVGNPHVEF